MNARLWHPWLRINRVLRVMLHTRWSAEAWSVVRVDLNGHWRNYSLEHFEGASSSQSCRSPPCNANPPFVSGTYCRTIIGAHRACQVISHFANLDGLPQVIMMIGSSGAMTRLNLRHFNTTTHHLLR